MSKKLKAQISDEKVWWVIPGEDKEEYERLGIVNMRQAYKRMYKLVKKSVRARRNMTRDEFLEFLGRRMAQVSGAKIKIDYLSVSEFRHALGSAFALEDREFYFTHGYSEAHREILVDSLSSLREYEDLVKNKGLSRADIAKANGFWAVMEDAEVALDMILWQSKPYLQHFNFWAGRDLVSGSMARSIYRAWDQGWMREQSGEHLGHLLTLPAIDVPLEHEGPHRAYVEMGMPNGFPFVH